MPYSKFSILIIEDDSRVSRLVRDRLSESFFNVRVEIAGSAAKAQTICQKFPPTLIVWDGVPNERGTAIEYLSCVPEALWKKVLPISIDAAILETAKARGAMEPLPKRVEALHGWLDDLAGRVKKILPKVKK